MARADVVLSNGVQTFTQRGLNWEQSANVFSKVLANGKDWHCSFKGRSVTMPEFLGA